MPVGQGYPPPTTGIDVTPPQTFDQAFAKARGVTGDSSGRFSFDRNDGRGMREFHTGVVGEPVLDPVAEAEAAVMANIPDLPNTGVPGAVPSAVAEQTIAPTIPDGIPVPPTVPVTQESITTAPSVDSQGALGATQGQGTPLLDMLMQLFASNASQVPQGNIQPDADGLSPTERLRRDALALGQ